MTRQHCSLSAIVLLTVAVLASVPTAADDRRPTTAPPAKDVNAAVEQVVRECAWPGSLSLPIGVTPRGTLIWCVLDPAALEPVEGMERIVIAAGVDGDPRTVEALVTHRGATVFGTEQAGRRHRVWIPIANPEAWWQ